MKKYWKLVAILIVIVLTVGTFYIQSTLSVSSLPEFEIKKQSGNEAVVDSLVITGDYFDQSISERLSINKDGSSYWKEASFLERLNGMHQPMAIKQLQEEYRGFMRGKNGFVQSFKENQDVLVHANISHSFTSYNFSEVYDWKFEISILDKQTNGETSFELSVPERQKYSYVNLYTAQIINNKLKIITRNYPLEGPGEEFHVYTFDIATNKLIDDEILTAIKSGNENRYYQIYELNEENTKNNKYVVWLETVFETKEHNEEYSEEIIENELNTYNLETKELNTIETPVGMHVYEDQHLMAGSTIYFSKVNEKGLEIMLYNIEDERMEDSIVIETPNQDKVENPHIRINDDKIYVIASSGPSTSSAPVVVVDLKSGKTLFQGEIVVANNAGNNDTFQTSLYDMEFK